MSKSYEIIDHSFDVIVLGAGGAGLRATLGMVAAGLSTACISKVYPTRSPHCRCTGRHQRSPREHGERRLGLAHVDTVRRLRLAG